MTLLVALVSPEREIWSGNANMVIAKTLDGDIGTFEVASEVEAVEIPERLAGRDRHQPPASARAAPSWRVRATISSIGSAATQSS